MVKDELVKEVARKSKMDEYSSKIAVDATIEVIKETLKNGGSVTLRGFGMFCIKERSPRSVRDINKSVQYTIASKKRVVFRPYKDLKGF